MASRIVRPATAFSLDLSSSTRKRPREHSERHLDFIRQLPCLICGFHGVDAAHVRYSDPKYGKPHTPMGQKPHDKWTVPLSRKAHEHQHRHNEREWWKERRLDPLAIAAALWANTGDVEAGEMIVNAFRREREAAT